MGRFRLSLTRILDLGEGVAKRIEVMGRTLLETAAVRPSAGRIGLEKTAEEFVDCVTERICLERWLHPVAFSRTALITRPGTFWRIVSATVRDRAFRNCLETQELQGGAYTPWAVCMNVKTGELRQKEFVSISKQRASFFAVSGGGWNSRDGAASARVLFAARPREIGPLGGRLSGLARGFSRVTGYFNMRGKGASFREGRRVCRVWLGHVHH
jgi:hypothetical protein